jgi:hypothetical protein
VDDAPDQVLEHPSRRGSASWRLLERAKRSSQREMSEMSASTNDGHQAGAPRRAAVLLLRPDRAQERQGRQRDSLGDGAGATMDRRRLLDHCDSLQSKLPCSGPGELRSSRRGPVGC